MQINPQYKGALKHLATKQEEAHRKGLDSEDWFLTKLDPFETDFYKIICSKAWRRLRFKTQVLTGRVNAHIRRRDSHSLEVLAVAGPIAEFLGLNVNLCRAIAVGHDLGHTPFGHAGEKFITEMKGKIIEFPINKEAPIFRHEVFSVIVCQFIERHGKGLNLTHQTLEGILRHSRGKGEVTVDGTISQEANTVMYADKISYLLSDFNDLFRRRLFSIDDYPELAKIMTSCGENQRLRTWYFVNELCTESAEQGRVSFSLCEAAKRFDEIKKLMYEVYNKADLFGAKDILNHVYQFLDYIASSEFNPLLALTLMTDEDVLYLHSQPCLSLATLKETSVWELIPFLKQNKDMSLTDPKLDW